MSSFFCYQKKIQFYETDLMGIVHHSNYLRYCEEARVAWALEKGLITRVDKGSASQLAVLETWVKHLRPLKFAEDLRVDLQVRAQGARMEFQYKLWGGESTNTLCALAKTHHVNLSSDFKPRRFSERAAEIIGREKWIETWLLNL